MLRPTRLRLAGLAVALAAAVAPPLTGAVAGLAGASHDHTSHDHGHDHAGAEHCRPTDGGPALCSHADEAPPGVDLTRLPSTRELRARRGAAGDALTAQAASGAVTCDGDGVSGSRVQAMYVVAADKPNRFADVRASIQTWAAGVDGVFAASAAQSGGERHVRYVTGAAVSGACTAQVLNVTVPAGATRTFSSSISAVQAQGHVDPSRKYLMWVDTSTARICGVATAFVDDGRTQGNRHNGLAPMYSRVDAPCWGRSAPSVEAHELLHNLGGVQPTAPNATAAGHCTDESDTMCYKDGSRVVMRQVCASTQEALLDCNHDDYYLAGAPATGSYLASHWNTADSRFLLGGGGDSSGYPAPTQLGVGIAVANPGVPGLPTTLTATVRDVPGRTAAFQWATPRRDCVFADATARETTVTCAAGSATRAVVTVTVNNGVTAPARASSTLTFTTAARALTITGSVNGVSGAGPVSACPKVAFPVTAKVVDAGSGAPVKGLRLAFVQTLNGRDRVLATVPTAADGTAAARVVGVHGGTVAVRTVKAGAFASQRGAATALSALPCATSVTASLSTAEVAVGGAVSASGRLSRTLGDDTSGVAGVKVSLVLSPTGGAAPKVLSSVKTAADGSFSLFGAPRTSGSLVVRFAASASYGASESTPMAVTVR